MKTIKKVAEVFTGGNEIATTIDNTSTNSQVAGAKAVYDATLDNYSTTEKVVGTWIDGKPLYEKVISATMPATSSDGVFEGATFTIGSNLDYVFIMAQWIEHTDGRKIPLNYLTNQPTVNARGNIGSDKTYGVVSGISGYSNLPVKAIVRYTKTTDTATNNLNASLTNTGSLVGMGDRAELTGNVTDNPSGDTI